MELRPGTGLTSGAGTIDAQIGMTHSTDVVSLTSTGVSLRVDVRPGPGATCADEHVRAANAARLLVSAAAAGTPASLVVEGGVERGPDGERRHWPFTEALRRAGAVYVLNGGGLPMDRPALQALSALLSHAARGALPPDESRYVASALRRWALPGLEPGRAVRLLGRGWSHEPAERLLDAAVTAALPGAMDAGAAADLSAVRRAMRRATPVGGPAAAGLLTLLDTLDRHGASQYAPRALAPLGAVSVLAS